MIQSQQIELNTWGVSLHPRQINLHNLVQSILSSRFLTHSFLFVFILTLFDPRQLDHVTSTQIQFIFWGAGLWLYTGFAIATYRFAACIQRLRPSLRIWTPVLAIPNIIFTTTMIGVGETYLLHQEWRIELCSFETMTKFFVLMQVLEYVFFRQFPKGLEDDAEVSKTSDAVTIESLPTDITVAGQTIAIDEILTIQSQDHFVEIRTKHGKHFLRSRLSDIITELPKDAGRQLHRSYWIANQSVTAMNISGQGVMSIETSDGGEWKVAKTRQKEIKDWIKKITPEG